MGWDAGSRPHDRRRAAAAGATPAAATGRRRAHRAAVLCHAAQGRAVDKAACGARDAAGRVAGLAPLRSAGRRGLALCPCR
eukprot:3620415-Alexandrium_andersonii.AAC.1